MTTITTTQKVALMATLVKHFPATKFATIEVSFQQGIYHAGATVKGMRYHIAGCFDTVGRVIISLTDEHLAKPMGGKAIDRLATEAKAAVTRKSHVPAITDDQMTCLKVFAAFHGRNWKSALRAAWMNASAVPQLQMLRNSHGPSWLKNFTFPRD